MNEKARAKRPISAGIFPASIIVLVMVSIVLAAATGGCGGQPQTGSLGTANLPQNVTSASSGPSTTTADSAYASAFVVLASERDDLVDLSNARWQEWSQEGKTQYPTAKYLVVDELEAFLARVEAMTPPGNADLLTLHQDWLATLQSLAAAEKALAASPSEAALQAENQAVTNENNAFSALDAYIEGV